MAHAQPQYPSGRYLLNPPISNSFHSLQHIFMAETFPLRSAARLIPPVCVTACVHEQADTHSVQSPLEVGIRMAMNAWQCNQYSDVNIIVHPDQTSAGWVRSTAPPKRLTTKFCKFFMTLMHRQMAVSRGLLSPAGLLRLLLNWGREALHPAEMADIRADLVWLSCCCSCQYVSGAFVGYAQLLICCGRLMLMTRGSPEPLSRNTAGQPYDAG